MSAIFELDYDRLKGDKRFAALGRELERCQTRIDSPETFNRYAREACHLWREHVGTIGKTSPLFGEFLGRITGHAGGTIPTPWGGVVITMHEHPRVEKFLVVRQGGYLALEKHVEKDEHLEIREGAGLLLSRRAADEPLVVEPLVPGGRFHFEPGMEHCLIGTEDLLVFERGTDPKGMDQDLIFLYEPDGAAS